MAGPRLLWTWPVATFKGKYEKKNNQKKPLAVWFPAFCVFTRQLDILVTILWWRFCFVPKRLNLNPLHPMQMDATLLVDNYHHWWILQVASVCTPCYMLLQVVAFCWELLGKVWDQSNFQPCRPTMLGVVVVSVCTLSFKPQYPHQNSPDWSP